MVINTTDNKTQLIKRGKGIWQNLYEFPLIETLNEIDENDIIESEKFDNLFNTTLVTIKLFNKELIVHKLSHQHIYTKFWIINTSDSLNFEYSWDTIGEFPVSTLIDNFLKQYKTN